MKQLAAFLSEGMLDLVFEQGLSHNFAPPQIIVKQMLLIVRVIVAHVGG